MLVGHLAAAETKGDFHLVTFLEKAGDGAGLHIIVMGVDIRADLDLFELGRTLLLLGRGFLLALLEAQLAIIEYLDDRSFLSSGDFDQIEPGFPGRVQRRAEGHNTLFVAILVNQQHLCGADFFVDAWASLFLRRRIGFGSASYGGSPSMA
jgi:hypothetical protein